MLGSITLPLTFRKTRFNTRRHLTLTRRNIDLHPVLLVLVFVPKVNSPTFFVKLLDLLDKQFEGQRKLLQSQQKRFPKARRRTWKKVFVCCLFDN